MQRALKGWKWLLRACRQAGPYLMMEIFLPGGTLIALLFFLRQRRNSTPA